MTLQPAIGEERRTFELSVGQLVWIALGTLFVGLRLAAVLSVPVGGIELDSLAGAWQAHTGNADDRFIPTLFQAVTSWSFLFTTSEAPARILALLASCTVPFAFYRMRFSLGETGAMAALLILGLDPFAVLLGSTAWHGGFDIAIVVWVLVLVHEDGLPDWVYGVAGFLVATAGALVLPIILAFAAVRLFTQQYPSRTRIFWTGGGALAGGLLATAGFGYGLQDPTIPPITALARGFETDWSNASTGSLVLFYGIPLLLLGVGTASYHAYQRWREGTWPEGSLGPLVAAGIVLAWIVVANTANDPVPAAAATIPFAILIGKETPRAMRAFSRIRWLYAAPAIAGLVLMLLIAGSYTVDWARVGRVGGAGDKLIVLGLVIAAVAFGGLLLSNRRTAPGLLVPFLGAAGLLMLSGAANVAFGGPDEPLPSPVNSAQGAEIRAIALATRTDQGGLIVVHPDFEAASTWPMRDSGTVVYASRVPPDATVVVWPVTLPAPDGFAVIDGQWSFDEIRRGPDGGFLRYLRWLSDRNFLKNGSEPLAVYLRTTP